MKPDSGLGRTALLAWPAPCHRAALRTRYPTCSPLNAEHCPQVVPPPPPPDSLPRFSEPTWSVVGVATGKAGGGAGEARVATAAGAKSHANEWTSIRQPAGMPDVYQGPQCWSCGPYMTAHRRGVWRRMWRMWGMRALRGLAQWGAWALKGPDRPPCHSARVGTRSRTSDLCHPPVPASPSAVSPPVPHPRQCGGHFIMRFRHFALRWGHLTLHWRLIIALRGARGQALAVPFCSGSGRDSHSSRRGGRVYKDGIRTAPVVDLQATRKLHEKVKKELDQQKKRAHRTANGDGGSVLCRRCAVHSKGVGGDFRPISCKGRGAPRANQQQTHIFGPGVPQEWVCIPFGFFSHGRAPPQTGPCANVRLQRCLVGSQ